MTAADEPQLADPNPLRAPRDVLLRRYQLIDLAWCGICDLPLIAILVPPGARYYGCVNKHCVRRLLPAEVTEQRVWCRFVAINQTLADGIPRARRHDVLRELLKRVVIGRASTDLTFDWRT